MNFSLATKTLILTFFFFCFSIVLRAQDSTSLNPSPLNPSPPTPAVSSEYVKRGLSDIEFKLSAAVLTFGFLIILFEVLLIKTSKIASEEAVKIITVSLIITSTIFLITAGYDNNQIAPAMGLLGTIAGYLLGKVNSIPSKANNDEKNS